jgi:hypothetical protein
MAIAPRSMVESAEAHRKPSPFGSSIMKATPATNDVFHLELLGAPATAYEIISATNLALPVADWALLGTATEFSPGHYEFNDPGMSTSLRRYYHVRTQ